MGEQKQAEPPKKEEPPYLTGLTPRKIGEFTIKLAKGTSDMLLNAIGVLSLAGCTEEGEYSKLYYEGEDAGLGKIGKKDSGPETEFGVSTDEQDAGEADTETTEQELWWPAHIISFEGEQEVMHNISLQFTEEGLAIWEIEGSYPSEDAIPEEVKQENAEKLQNVLAYSKVFFDAEAYEAIVPNNVFLVVSGTSYGGRFMNGAFGFRMESEEEEYTANCFEGCEEYQTLALKSSGAGVVFHELLHDAWHSYMTQEERAGFASKARLFFNVVGNSWEDDQLVGAIWHGQYHDPENPGELLELPFEAELGGPELGNWAGQNLPPEMDDGEKEQIKNMLKAYFRMHSTLFFGRTYGMDKEARNGFDDAEMSPEEAEEAAQTDTTGYVVKEGFTFMCANYPVLDDLIEHPYSTKPKLMPSFMKSSYYGIVKDEHLNNLSIPGYGYFVSEGNFEEFAPYIVDFANWMKEQHPELNNIVP